MRVRAIEDKTALLLLPHIAVLQEIPFVSRPWLNFYRIFDIMFIFIDDSYDPIVCNRSFSRTDKKNNDDAKVLHRPE